MLSARDQVLGSGCHDLYSEDQAQHNFRHWCSVTRKMDLFLQHAHQHTNQHNAIKMTGPAGRGANLQNQHNSNIPAPTQLSFLKAACQTAERQGYLLLRNAKCFLRKANRYAATIKSHPVAALAVAAVPMLVRTAEMLFSQGQPLHRYNQNRPGRSGVAVDLWIAEEWPQLPMRPVLYCPKLKQAAWGVNDYPVWPRGAADRP